MSVNSIYNSSYGNYNSSIWGMNVNNLDDANSSSSEKAKSKTSSSASGKSGYSNSNSTLSGLSSALQAAMDDMGLGASDRVTYQTMMEYRDKLQSAFIGQVKSDLKKAGLDENSSFRLVSGTDGSGVQVVADDPETKAAVEKYFKDNPDMVAQFEKVQGLNKMEETRKQQSVDVKSIRSRLQVEAMTTWYADSSSGFMAFSGQGASYYSGINTMA